MTRSPLFDAVRAALERFGALEGLPPVARIDEVLSGVAGVRFVAAPPGHQPSAEYNLTVARTGQVPTRETWHDFANALVWATFPAAKRALHARQAKCLEARALTRAPNRTSEEDALAILDESGVVQLDAGPVVFGHAILETVALGRGALGDPRGVRLTACSLDEVDAQLTERLSAGWPRRVAELDRLPPLIS